MKYHALKNKNSATTGDNSIMLKRKNGYKSFVQTYVTRFIPFK